MAETFAKAVLQESNTYSKEQQIQHKRGYDYEHQLGKTRY